MSEVSPLENLSAVQEYLRRVRAQFTSLFRAATVVKVSGYDREIAAIWFNRDGSIYAPADYAPTEDEEARIGEAIRSTPLPKVVRLTGEAPSELPEELKNTHHRDLFTFRNPDGEIVMYQQRVDLKNGDKRYVPWTYWSDGVWRRAEPDDRLPLYGMENVPGMSRIFIHEGAKAARAASEAAEDRRHPWHDFLSTGAHIGWIGGIHQVRRGDWQQLRRCSPDEIIIVPDNDSGGQRVVPLVSRQVRCRASQVVWDGEWPYRFDLADPMPDKYMIRGAYIGPRMEEMLFPAEWATDLIPNPEGRGRPVAVARDSFLDRWYRIERTKTYCPKDRPTWQLDQENFNAYMRPFSDVADTAGVFKKNAATPITQPTFAPDRPQRLIREGGTVQLNQYIDMRIKAVPGDTTTFHDFMEYMVPDEVDRDHLMRWCRTIFARPDIRMGYGVLVLSEKQGVGKSTLGTILARMIGKEQTSFPGDEMIQSDFNGWLVNKRLVVVNEIYAGQNWRTYNRLKSKVTDPDIEANIKHQATWTFPNWAHFYCCSNSMEALRIEDEDRRWFVPKLTEELWPERRYDELYAWMADGGLSALAHEWMNSNDFVRPGSRAPETEAKRELAENSRPPEHEFVVALMDKLEEGQALDLTDTWAFLKDLARSPYLTTQRVSAMAKSGGFGITPQRRISGRKRRLLVRDQHEAKVLETESGEKLAQRIVDPEEVWKGTERM